MNDLDASRSSEGLVTKRTGKQLDWQFDGKPVRVLFLCLNNSARSQMAEALIRHLSQGQLEVFSAGSQPAAQIHPLATRAIARLGADMSQHIPKSLHLFEDQAFDRVVILCDTEQEDPLDFPGNSSVIIWNTPDPCKAEGTELERTRAFDRLAIELNTRIRLLLTLLEREKCENT
jgi:ArsR family transcriptional regulator, arsenate/arsenite/antimonite-responsive transcriptional repressor / arsenate reductase (thioredoxin)